MRLRVHVRVRVCGRWLMILTGSCSSFLLSISKLKMLWWVLVIPKVRGLDLGSSTARREEGLTERSGTSKGMWNALLFALWPPQSE